MTQEPAKSFLERLQKDMYAAAGKPPRKVDDILTSDLKERVFRPLLRGAGITDDRRVDEIFLQHKEELSGALLTSHEDPLGHAIIQGLEQRIQNAASGLLSPLPEFPIVGTVPTGDVNAITVAVPGSRQCVILIQDQLFNYALLFSKIMAMSFPHINDPGKNGFLSFSADPSEVIANIENSPYISQRFRQLILAYLTEGSPGRAPAYILEQPHMSMAQILYNSMELFVMGHEYGHIIAGHLDGIDRSAAALGSKEVQIVARNWKQEHEADALGMRLAITAKQEEGFDIPMSFWGADFFFTCAEVVEKGLSVIETGQEGNVQMGSHPPPNRRRKVIRAILRQESDSAAAAIQLADILDSITKYLWESTKPLLMKLHERHISVSQNWLGAPSHRKP
ncbi:hypothetical protein ACF1G5_13105 [Streptomyces coeruleorubidus]|uniref:hypothetical protein n=1 Tax=Streptomyces coeruleorubidus TaxID=116188 RepID=UPI0036F4DF06